MLCPLPQTALTGTRVSPSSALPGDALNSVVDPRFRRDPPVLSTKEPSSVGFLDLLQQKKKKKKELSVSACVSETVVGFCAV